MHMQRAAMVEDKIFQALADPTRRAIFESLTRGEAAVKDLTARFDAYHQRMEAALERVRSRLGRTYPNRIGGEDVDTRISWR